MREIPPMATKVMNVSLDLEVYNRVKALAKQQHRTATSQVTLLIDECLKAAEQDRKQESDLLEPTSE
jgi:hypothetical protein